MVRGIKAYQGIVSKPVLHFDFLNEHCLKKYHNIHEPVVVFGIYDLSIINKHKGIIILRWCGNDVRIQKNNLHLLLNHSNVVNVTPLPKVKKYLNNHGLKCHLIKFMDYIEVKPLQLGNKVYSYLNKYKPEYHGSNLVKKINSKYDGEKMNLKEGSCFNRTPEKMIINFKEMKSDEILRRIKSFGIDTLGVSVRGYTGKLNINKIYSASKIQNELLLHKYRANKTGEFLLLYDGKLLVKTIDGIIKLNKYD